MKKKSTFRPRDLINKEVAGICGVARLADKARAAHTGNIGTYKYGADSEQDTAILAFLGISAADFQETTVRIRNDVKLGAWVLDHCGKSEQDISVFNRKVISWWQNNIPRDDFSKRRRRLAEKDADRWLFWFFPSAWFWKRFFR